MKLSTSLVAVKKITSSKSCSEFDSERIEKLAQEILKAEGIISPLILNRTSLESYEVVDGHFEYYAAVKAREIDPRKGEMISAYIIDSENSAISSAIKEQIELLRASATDDLPQVDETAESVDRNLTAEILRSVVTKISNFETKISTFENLLIEKVNKIEQTTNNAKPSSEIFSVDAVINKLEDKLATVIGQSIEKYFLANNLLKLPSKPCKTLLYEKEKGKIVLQGFNTFDASQLKQKLSECGVRTAKSLSQKIYQVRLLEPYNSIEDVITKINGLTENTMQKIIDVW
ncbi:ParB/Srx family N-terminal domain-containing protein [Tumidithrix elongata RA019]|uniref:ParB/Srx family N-terminal domain-containing protein n=1 Tax=Tumidithrix elongata BACA0141 TaxID=2716417 RepID=A0AAW9Q1P8_9CYAN|nr:ParB/Srx family N-terminal domain-containing protein [Tumidithrix elongata RA019]